MKKLLVGLSILLALTLLFVLPGSLANAQDPGGGPPPKPPHQGPPTVPNKESLLEPFIVGGQNADPGEWPWQARVNPGPYLCGGALINEGWVLTAAHCVFDANGNVFSPGQVNVVLGDHSKSSADGTEQNKTVSSVIPHPDYNPATNDNDVALLELTTPATIIPGQVETIPLNDNDSISTGTLATVTGWGTTSFGGTTADILQEVTVPIVSNQTCNTSYGSITANMICAGYQQGGKDSCQGDSGGPLVTPDGSGGWKHVGVVSWGNGCAFPDYYGVYARTSKFVTWIEDTINADTSPPPPPPPPVSGTELIVDGDFELLTGWQEYSSNGYLLIGNFGFPAFSGVNLAWLSGAHDEYSEVSQAVTIPAGGTATLTYYYYIVSEDVCGYDFGDVTLNGIPLLEYDLCQDTATGGWLQQTIDVSSFSGQTITLAFSTFSDSSLISSLYIDQVSLVYTDEAPPPPPPPPGTGPVFNGDFEAGGDGTWEEFSSNGFALILPDTFGLPVTPRSGSYVAWLGGLDDELSTLSQDVIVPNNDSATLVYYYQILSDDFCGYDFAGVEINGQPLETYNLCSETVTSTWQQASFNLSSFKGQTVTLNFYTETDLSYISSLFIDDVEITTSAPPPPPPPPPADFVLTAEPGSGSIELSWTVPNNPNVETYRVGRREAGSPQGAPFTTIATTSSTTYFDSDDSLEVDKEYRYRIEALDSQGQVLTTSNTASAFFGRLVLRIPQVVAETGEEVIIPLNISNANSLRITASDIWLDYDSSVVQFVGVEETALTVGYAWAPSSTPETVNGSIERIKIAAIDLNPPEIYGDGSLFWLIFEAVGGDDDRTDLNLRGKQEGLPGGGTSITDLIGAPFVTHEPTLDLNDGRLIVQNPPEAQYVFGDVNGDTNISAIDAATAMAIAVGKVNAGPAQVAAGDINGNGSIQAADAAMILYRAANADWPPLPTQSAAELSAAAAQQITLKLDDITGAPGQIVQTRLHASDLKDFAGGDFTIIYDPNLIESFTGVEKTGLTGNFQLFDFYDNGQGTLRISMANPQTISGSGVLANLTVKLSTKAGQLPAQGASSARMHFADAAISNQNGLDFETNFANNQIILLSATVTVIGDKTYLPLIAR